MSFIAPGFLTAAIAAAIGIVALHLIVTLRARSVAFPTARFAPDVASSSRSRSLRLSDLLLLLVRVLTVLAVGAALARPVLTPRRERVARVILADVSGAVARIADVRDSVRAQYRQGDELVAFDTTARLLATPDSIGTQSLVAAPGSVSAALVAALHAGSRMRSGADSIELVLVSPALTNEMDRATRTIRNLWAGRARLIRVAAATPDSLRVPLTDSTIALAVPRFAVRRNRIDTVDAVVAGKDVVVGRFERRWRYPADSLVSARVTARWVDGDPAAIRLVRAGGCERSSAIVFDSAGDMLLRPGVVRIRAALATSCIVDSGAWSADVAHAIEGSGRLATVTDFAAPGDVDAPLARWFAMAALLLAIAEMILRRSPSADDSEADR